MLITINLELDAVPFKLFKTVPTFENLLTFYQRDKLIIGKNIINVNPYVYGKLKQLQSLGGYQLEFIKSQK